VKLLGVIGDPIEHSLSPVLFDYLFKALELPYRYDAYQITPEGLEGFAQTCRLSGLLGINVTIPHKETIIPHLDEVADEADRLGAVNTVVNDDGRLLGHNTDLAGFINPLRERNVDLKDSHVIVFGAGGAARAVVQGLQTLNVVKITLANRSPERADALAQALCRDTDVETISLSDSNLYDALADARLLVNATSVGMLPQADASPLGNADGLHEDLIVYDLVYRPLKTRLLAEAQAQGAVTIDGLEMLIGQALESFRIWLPDAPKIPTWLTTDLRGYLRGKLLDDAEVAD